jgi:hypothetical protein
MTLNIIDDDDTVLPCHFCESMSRLAGQLANTTKRYRFLHRSKRDGTVRYEILGVCDRHARYAGKKLVQGAQENNYEDVSAAILNGRLNAVLILHSRRRIPHTSNQPGGGGGGGNHHTFAAEGADHDGGKDY